MLVSVFKEHGEANWLLWPVTIGKAIYLLSRSMPPCCEGESKTRKKIKT
jgi:hypothetical protein